MPFQKGNKLAGSRKGTPNKVNAEIKRMIVEALKNKGGVKYFEKQADANPNAFMALVGKVMPLQVSGEDGGPLTTRVIHQEADAD